MHHTCAPRADFALSFTPETRRHIALAVILHWHVLLVAATAPKFSEAPRFQPCTASVPKPMREMRGAWVATVSNIDWPSNNGLTTAQQKSGLLAILDRAVDLKLNTLIFQVRPACDALYASPFEPWSEYLTGAMGKAPEPFYDPLAFAIEEAHKRGLELHAWFNPYRARHAAARTPISSNHISRTKPHLVRQYGRSLWLDPGEREVQAYSRAVILDVVNRYDVDGVHIDDYFYPYKETDRTGKEIDFPDEASWKRFGVGGRIDRDEWRRENVNNFVHQLYDAVRKAKPWVRFGVSPFGIWRPGNPAQIRGFDAYAKLYADSRKWLINGWVDYLAPQLYWGISPPEQSFPALLDWWTAQNKKERLIAPGMDSTKTARRWPPEEILNQIHLARKQPGGGGHIHWNMRALMNNDALGSALQRELYSEPALVPVLSRVRISSIEKPKLTAREKGPVTELTWSPGAGQQKPWLWVVQSKNGKKWNTQVLPGSKSSCTIRSSSVEVVSVTAVDRVGNLGRTTALQRGN